MATTTQNQVNKINREQESNMAQEEKYEMTRGTLIILKDTLSDLSEEYWTRHDECYIDEDVKCLPCTIESWDSHYSYYEGEDADVLDDDFDYDGDADDAIHAVLGCIEYDFGRNYWTPSEYLREWNDDTDREYSDIIDVLSRAIANSKVIS